MDGLSELRNRLDALERVVRMIVRWQSTSAEALVATRLAAVEYELARRSPAETGEAAECTRPAYPAGTRYGLMRRDNLCNAAGAEDKEEP